MQIELETRGSLMAMSSDDELGSSHASSFDPSEPKFLPSVPSGVAHAAALGVYDIQEAKFLQPSGPGGSASRPRLTASDRVPSMPALSEASPLCMPSSTPPSARAAQLPTSGSSPAVMQSMQGGTFASGSTASSASSASSAAAAASAVREDSESDGEGEGDDDPEEMLSMGGGHIAQTPRRSQGPPLVLV